MEPFLRWQGKDNLGYNFTISFAICTITIYIDDLIMKTDDIQAIQPQIQKLPKWSHVDLNLSKCVITGWPNKSKFKLNAFRAYI